MTTTTKKSLLTILMLVFVCVCCFTAVASAEGSILVEAFEEYVTENLMDVEADTLFNNNDDVKAVREAVNKYNLLSETEKTMIKANVAAKYNALRLEAKDALTVDTFVTHTLFDKLNKYNGARIRLSDEAAINDIKVLIYGNGTTVEGLSEKALGWVTALEAWPNLAKAEAAIAELKVRLQAAIDAIDAIQYYDPAVDAMGVKVAGSYIVLASEDSIDAADEAIYNIYEEDFFAPELEAEWVYVTNLSAFKAAGVALEAEYAKAAVVSEKILAVYNNDICTTEGAEIYWTVAKKIVAVAEDYIALADDAKYHAEYNDLQSVVKEFAKLDEMMNRLMAIEDEIIAVNTKIMAIGKVTYTTGSQLLIADARNAFEALDNDIVVADKATYAANKAAETFVGQYAVLVAAEEEYARLEAQFNALCAQIDHMAEVYKNGEDIIEAYPELQALYLNAEQNNPEIIDRLAEKVYDDTYEVENYDHAIANYKEAYAFYAARALEILGKVDTVIDLIDLLPNPMQLNTDHKYLLDTANSAYNALTEEDKRFVDNYDKLATANAQFNKLMEVADSWVAAVDAIGTVAATQESFDKVAAAKTAFAALDAAAQNVIAGLSSDDTYWGKYATAYATYVDAVALSDALYNEIDAIADKMGAIVTNDALIPVGQVIAWKENVVAIKAEYEALALNKAQSAAYLVEYREADYDNYLAALRNMHKYDVEAVISALPADVTISVADRAAVAAAREVANEYIALYAGAIDPTSAEYIRNYNDLLAAEAAIADMVEDLEAWEAAVEALVGGDYTNIDKIVADKDALAIDLNAAEALLNEYNAMTADEKAYTAEDGENDYEKLVAIIDAAIAQAGKVESGMEDIIAKDELTKDDVDNIEDILDQYEDLSETQKDLLDQDVVDDFLAQAEKLVFATSFEAIIDNLYDAVVGADKDITSDTPVIIGLVKALYNEFTEEQKALIGNYNKIAEIEDAYKAAEAAGKVVNVTSLKAVVDQLKASLEAAEGNITTMQNAIKAAEDKIALLDAQLELTEEELNDALANAAAANKAVETLQGTVTTIIIIFSILIAGCIAAIVVLLLKKKA